MEIQGTAQLNYTTDEVNNLLPSIDFIGSPSDFVVRPSTNPYKKYELVKKNNIIWSCTVDEFYGEWVDSAWTQTTIFKELDKMRAVYIVEDLKEKVGDLTQLKTTNKTSLVNAINELYDSIPKITQEDETLIIE